MVGIHLASSGTICTRTSSALRNDRLPSRPPGVILSSSCSSRSSNVHGLTCNLPNRRKARNVKEDARGPWANRTTQNPRISPRNAPDLERTKPQTRAADDTLCPHATILTAPSPIRRAMVRSNLGKILQTGENQNRLTKRSRQTPSNSINLHLQSTASERDIRSKNRLARTEEIWCSLH